MVPKETLNPNTSDTCIYRPATWCLDAISKVKRWNTAYRLVSDLVLGNQMKWGKFNFIVKLRRLCLPFNLSKIVNVLTNVYSFIQTRQRNIDAKQYRLTWIESSRPTQLRFLSSLLFYIFLNICFTLRLSIETSRDILRYSTFLPLATSSSSHKNTFWFNVEAVDAIWIVWLRRHLKKK